MKLLKLLLPVAILLEAGCSESSPTEPDTWSIDPSFAITWKGTYPLGTVAFRVWRSKPSAFFASFAGDAVFTLASTGESRTYYFDGYGVQSDFWGWFDERGAALGLAAHFKGSQLDGSTLRLKWDEVYREDIKFLGSGGEVTLYDR